MSFNNGELGGKRPLPSSENSAPNVLAPGANKPNNPSIHPSQHHHAPIEIPLQIDPYARTHQVTPANFLLPTY